MPSTLMSDIRHRARPYRIDRNGGMVWEWEKDYKKGEIKMPFKKKEKRCYFCSRELKNRIYQITIHKRKAICCSMCAFVYKVIKDEKDNKRFRIVEQIFFCIKEEGKHCKSCRFFNTNRAEYCRKDMWTGIGSNEHEYPGSYALHGCSHYKVL